MRRNQRRQPNTARSCVDQPSDRSESIDAENGGGDNRWCSSFTPCGCWAAFSTISPTETAGSWTVSPPRTAWRSSRPQTPISATTTATRRHFFSQLHSSFRSSKLHFTFVTHLHSQRCRLAYLHVVALISRTATPARPGRSSTRHACWRQCSSPQQNILDPTTVCSHCQRHQRGGHSFRRRRRRDASRR